MATLAEIYDWFMTGKRPTQAQFWASWGSFWNKNESIPQSAVSGLTNVLNAKVENDQFNAHKVANDAHEDLFEAKEDKAQKGIAGGYTPLNDDLKIDSNFLNIINDLVAGGPTALLSAEQGKVLKTQIDAINTLLTSDNVNLDTVQELVDAIETVQMSLSTILVNDLTTGGTTKALTAEMGKTLKGLIDELLAQATVDQTIIDGSTNSVSGNAVFDALATKASISSVHNPVTLGTANGLSLATQQLSLGLASSGVTGALSGTDWNTFNGKQNAISGTTNRLAKFGSGGVVDSGITELANGNVLIGTTTDNGVDKLQVNGAGWFEGNVQSTNFKTTGSNFSSAPTINNTFLDLGYYGDYEESVILLHEIYDSGSPINRNFVNGEITVHRGSTSSLLATGVYKVNTGSAYLNSVGAVSAVGGSLNNGSALWTCAYNDKKYFCLRFTGISARGFSFRGDYGSGSGGEILKLVKVRNSYNGTVYNSTIQGTLTLFSTPLDSQLHGSLDVTGTISASPAVNSNQVVVKSQLDAVAARPYKVYTALLSQTGTNAPTATVLENTLGGTVVWTRTNNGVYDGTLTGAFASNKTTVQITGTVFNAFFAGFRNDANTVTIGSSNKIGDGEDALILNLTIEIRVYN